jgi:DNA-binding transcriptional LysR family regulator
VPAEELSRFDWDDFKTFVAAARAGSFGRAAKDLGIGSVAIGKRIGRLEENLGVLLFKRLASGVELTNDGRRVLSYAKAAETSLVSAVNATRNANEAIEGECTLSMGDGLGTYWVPRFFAGFSCKLPNIALRISSSPSRTTTKSASHDIQIQYTDALDPDLVATRVATLHFMLFASQEYLRENGKPTALSELASHRLVDLTLADSSKGTFSALTGFGNSAALMVNANGTQCEAIRWGAGIGILPTYASLLYDNLVPIIPSVRHSFPVFLCYERDVGKHPVVRATLNFLRETVFDSPRMPWFADEFAMPDTHWHAILRGCLRGEPDSVVVPLNARRQADK